MNTVTPPVSQAPSVPYVPYVSWSNLLNIGIKKIDDEHKSIISSIDALHKHTRDKKHQGLYTPNIRLVAHAIKVHLQTEEELLMLAGYEHLKEHKELHDVMRQRQSLSNRFEDVDSLLEFYKFWWVNHIMHEDHKYIEHVRAYRSGLKRKDKDAGPPAQPQEQENSNESL